MKIITLTGNQFEEFAKKHKYRNYFQTLSYAKLMKTDGYDYHLLGFLNNSNELIGASMILFKKIFFSYKIAYAPYGFLIDYTNSDAIEEITEKLKLLLYKQKFLYLKINPRIECSKRNKDGNIISYNPEINDIMEILQKNDYIHHGFSNFFEDMKPRWNAVLKLTASNEKLYKNLDKQIRNKISKAQNCGIELVEDYDLDFLYECVKRKHTRNYKYYQKLLDLYGNNAKIYTAVINIEKYLENSRIMYEIEAEKNEEISKKLLENGRYGSNMSKIITQKMESDKILAIRHNHLVKATKLYSKYQGNVKVGSMLVIEDHDGANLVIEGFNKKYKDFDPNYLLKWEAIKKWNKEGKKYFNMNGIVGEFNSNNKYSGLNESKLSFGADALEYIGEFDLIINKPIYNIYIKRKERKLKKKKD